MTAESVKEWVNSSLSRISSEKFHDCICVTEVELKPLTDQLIIIVSDIFRVKLTLKYKNGTTADLKTVYKMEPTKKGFDKFAKEMGKCDNETLIYSNILKLMEKLIIEKNKSKLLLWPECYLCENNKFLLQDLTAEGYEVIPTYEMLPINHALLALKTLGQYHGMSLVLVQRGAIEVNKLPLNYLAKNVKLINNMYAGGLQQLADFIEQNWQGDWKVVADKLRKTTNNIGDKLKDLVYKSSGKCSVLIHGDFTIRNLLFKYEEDSKDLVDLKLIDFQGPSWSNLAFDIIHLLCSSLLPQIREKHLDELLQVYSTSLSECLLSHGYKGDFITLSDVKQSYDSLKYMEMLVTLFAIPAFIGSKDDTSFIDSLVDIANTDPSKEKITQPFKNSFFKIKSVSDAMRFQLELSLKQNTL